LVVLSEDGLASIIAFRKCAGHVLQTGIYVEDDGEDASITTVAQKSL
jgi:hypothetical protein